MCVSSAGLRYFMTNTRGKTKVAIPVSKRWKIPGSTLSSTPLKIVSHLFLQFSPGPYEDQYQHLKEQPLGLGRCIYWEAL
ncbi:hypothetical protein PVK06_024778 [Gossypium arboreum]|uniref:Uncharacterized protein n=1 Tax=Gossypium arboreum TaxID=29729 RepID=A0ABR0PF11_GOSAR|nr:hypothetical protein PVK06_024778 [Gossypium arboreum]